MLDFLKGKRKGNCIGSPCKGKAVALTEVPDPTFSEKILGDGFAVIPSEGKIYAPADGEVTVVFDTLHAITMTTDQGAELLIHIGLDMVQLDGKGFEDPHRTGHRDAQGGPLHGTCCCRRPCQKGRSSAGCGSGEDSGSRTAYHHSGPGLQYR